MSDVTDNPLPGQSAAAFHTTHDLSDRFPSAFTILFATILFLGALTWVLPAGQYDRAPDKALGKDAPVPGIFHNVEADPQGQIDALMAPVAGYYDPASYTANAIDVSISVLAIGGLGVMNRTGAIDTGIAGAMARTKGRERWMIPILMALSPIGGTTCLPAFHDLETAVGARLSEEHGLEAMEVTDEVFESPASPASIVFDLAADRMPRIKAPLAATLGG